MKMNLLLIAAIVSGVSSAFADTKEAYEGITSDILVKSVVDSVAKKHAMECVMPGLESVNLRQIGDTNNYNYDMIIECAKIGSSNTSIGVKEKMLIEVQGFYGGTNQVQAIFFSHVV